MSDSHKHTHEHHHEVDDKTVGYLIISFVINMLLTVVEIIGGLIAGSVSLIGDALHNTSDAFSILIAVIAFKIAKRKAVGRYTYGFKRAEILGGFVNLILLFVAGVYLAVEGIEKLIWPQPIDGAMIIWVSVVALFIDTATARLSHHGSEHNSNMRMLFLHNLADALGSVGVIISGLCVLYFDIYRVDGIVALMIAAYMIFQAVVSFPKLAGILMNAAPEGLDIEAIRQKILTLNGVRDVHHIHIWTICEGTVSLECHIVSDDTDMATRVAHLLDECFEIEHCNIQIEHAPCPDNACTLRE